LFHGISGVYFVVNIKECFPQRVYSETKCVSQHTKTTCFTYLFPNLISSACAMPKNNLLYCHISWIWFSLWITNYNPFTFLSQLSPSHLCHTLHRQLFVAPYTVTFLSHLIPSPFCRTLHRYLFVAPNTVTFLSHLTPSPFCRT